MINRRVEVAAVASLGVSVIVFFYSEEIACFKAIRTLVVKPVNI